MLPESRLFRIVYDPLSMTVGGISLSSALSAGGTIAGLGGAGLSALGILSGADASAAAARANAPASQLAAQYTAQKAIWDADEARSASQRQAMDVRRQTDMIESKLQAGAAAGGGSATDDTVGQLGGQIEQRGHFEELMDMYAGEQRARGLEDYAKNALIKGANQNTADEYKAEVGQRNALYSAGGTIIGGAGSLFSRYGRNNFGFGGYGGDPLDIRSPIAR